MVSLGHLDRFDDISDDFLLSRKDFGFVIHFVSMGVTSTCGRYDQRTQAVGFFEEKTCGVHSPTVFLGHQLFEFYSSFIVHLTVASARGCHVQGEEKKRAESSQKLAA